MTRAGWLRIVPFAVFMAFIGVQQGVRWLLDEGIVHLPESALLYIYPVKVVVVGGLLLLFFRHYSEFRLSDIKSLRHSAASILLGIVVFILWINMDWPFASFGSNHGFNPNLVVNDASRLFLIIFRFAGAVLVVPVMEELFWRSFLMRYIINPDFECVRIGTFTLASFLIGSVLFGLEHHLVVAGIMAGMAYSLLLYWTKSIVQCTLSHAVTNLALGLYVMKSGAWQFW